MNGRTWGGWVIVSALAGVITGIVWALAAPRASYVVAGEELLGTTAQPQEFFAADFFLGAMLAAVGFVLALVWARRGGQRPMAALLGLLTGGVVAIVIAVTVGEVIAGTTPTVAGLADGTQVSAGLNFRSWAMMVWWPAVVSVVFAVALTGARTTTRSVVSEAEPTVS